MHDKTVQEFCLLICVKEPAHFPLQLLRKLDTRVLHDLPVPHYDQTTSTKTLVTLTFHSPLIRKFTDFFHNTNLTIASGTNNTQQFYSFGLSPLLYNKSLKIMTFQRLDLSPSSGERVERKPSLRVPLDWAIPNH